MGNIQNKEFHIETFNSFANFKKAILSRKNSVPYAGSNSSEQRDYSFTRTHSFNEATDLMINGYNGTYEKIKEQTKTIAKTTTNIMNRQKQYVVAGALPIVPKFLTGHPQNMLRFKNAPVTSRNVHIYYDVTANCGVDARDLEKAGICLAGLFQMFESQGYRIKVEVGFTSVDDDVDLCKVLLKDYTDYVNVLKLAYPLTHPSFFRRHMFKWLETTPVTKNYHCGYGHAIFYEERDEKKIIKTLEEKKVLDKNAFYVYYGLIEKCNFDTKTLYEHLQQLQ